MIGVGQEFPYFVANGVDCENHMGEIAHDDFQDWKVFYFYPKDFTFICPTEIRGMDMLVSEASVVGFSGDNEFCKLAWKENNELISNIQHTLACDGGLDDTGRNASEVLRTLQALKAGGLTGCEWQPGDDYVA